MKKLIPFAVLAVVIAIAVSACGTTNSVSPVSADSSAAVDTPATAEEILDAHPEAAMTACEGYNALVDQGWNNETIYSELEAAGTFDGWTIDSHEAFGALTRWCYSHTS